MVSARRSGASGPILLIRDGDTPPQGVRVEIERVASATDPGIRPLRRSDVDKLVEQVRHLAVRLQLPSAAGRPVFPGLVDVSSGRSEAADGAGRVPERARGSLVEDSAVSHNVARGGSVSTADAGCPSYPSPKASMTP